MSAQLFDWLSETGPHLFCLLLILSIFDYASQDTKKKLLVE